MVRLSSELHGGCGSGFIAEGGKVIITNFHVAQLLCSADLCREMRIEAKSGDTVMRSLTSRPVDLRIRQALPAVDLVFLEAPTWEEPVAALTVANSVVKPGQNVRLLGYPACGNLAVTSGIVSDGDMLTFSTGAKGASGSSGGPVLDEHGTVVGIAFQADSLLRAFYDKFAGGSFNLRAIRSEIVAGLRHTEDNGSASALEAQSELLIKYYQSEVRGAVGLSRLMRSVFFLNLVKALTDHLAASGSSADLLQVGAMIDHFPGALLDLEILPAEGPVRDEFQRLIFIADMEERGPFRNFVERIQPETLRDALRRQGKDEEQIIRYLNLLPNASEAAPGLTPLTSVLAILAAAFLLLIISAWGWSAGYIFAKSQGTFGRRFLTMTVTALLWPFSLLFFYSRNRSPRTAQARISPQGPDDLNHQ